MQQVLNWITSNPAATVAIMCAVYAIMAARTVWHLYTFVKRCTGEVHSGDLVPIAIFSATWPIALPTFGVTEIFDARRNRIPAKPPKPIPSSGDLTNTYAYYADMHPKPVPYGSKPDESARPVTQAQLEPVLARIAALEKLPATTNPSQISSSVPQGVRAWRDGVDSLDWVWDGAQMWVRSWCVGEWYRSLYFCVAELERRQNTPELHGLGLAEVYASWLKRGDK